MEKATYYLEKAIESVLCYKFRCQPLMRIPTNLSLFQVLFVLKLCHLDFDSMQRIYQTDLRKWDIVIV